MLAVPFSEEEFERMRTVRELDILDTPPEDRFDRITRLAVRLFNVPMAAICLTDRNRHFYKSRVGLPLTQIPRRHSFCDHSIAAGDMLIVEDATGDRRFQENPYVTGSMHLRFYAGVPLRAENDKVVGVLCLIHHETHRLTEEDKVALRDLAAMAETELRRGARRALKSGHGNEKWFRALVDHLPDGVIMLDRHGTIESFNPAAERIFGGELANMTGCDISLLTVESLAHFENLVRNQERGAVHESIGRRADGELFPMEISISVMYIGGRRKSAVMVRDITARKQAAAKQRELDAARENYHAAAAHELRSPLASVIGFAEMLVERKLSDETLREIAGIISGETRRLVKLINEMLELARLGAAGSRDFDIQVQQVGPLIERTVQGLGGMPESSRIRLDIVPGLPEVPLDAQKMQQALIDVLSNAIKYSPKGGPIVVRAQPARRQGADAVAISVIDQGIGMTPSQKARMFEPFYRAKQLQHAEGTGLGMAIVKEIIELHSGTVEIESALEAGTEVTMYLPLTNAAVAGSAAAILSPAATAEPLLSMTPIAPVAPAVPGTTTLAVRN